MNIGVLSLSLERMLLSLNILFLWFFQKILSFSLKFNNFTKVSLYWLFWVNFFRHLPCLFNIESLMLLQKNFLVLYYMYDTSLFALLHCICFFFGESSTRQSFICTLYLLFPSKFFLIFFFSQYCFLCPSLYQFSLCSFLFHLNFLMTIVVFLLLLPSWLFFVCVSLIYGLLSQRQLFY